ncbi:MAG: hypothetical protein ACJA08_000811 [Cyclobacteriaceae bacterium]|jgi:hypothetical protein
MLEAASLALVVANSSNYVDFEKVLPFSSTRCIDL